MPLPPALAVEAPAAGPAAVTMSRPGSVAARIATTSIGWPSLPSSVTAARSSAAT